MAPAAVPAARLLLPLLALPACTLGQTTTVKTQTTTTSTLEGGAKAATTTPWVPLTLLPDKYLCETKDCSKWNSWEWSPVSFANSTSTCENVRFGMVEDLESFTKKFPEICRSLANYGMKHETCRQDYCQMYEKAVNTLMFQGGPEYYGAAICRPLLDFNKTLCEQEYRDAEVFCDCLCPMINLFEPATGCEDQIMQFLILGRRSPQLQELYPMSGLCAADLCRWFELIGDPAPPNPVRTPFGIPGTCHVNGLPYRPKQCERMIITQGDAIPGSGGKRVALPYDPCPWNEPSPEDSLLQCSDGREFYVNPLEADSWSVCAERDFRWTCPKNFPVMCEGHDCDGSVDHCCQTDVGRCKTGQERMCPPLLMRDVPELRGYLTPSAAFKRITTTTMNPLDAFLLRGVRTTTTLSIDQQVAAVPVGLFIGVSVGACVVCLFSICACIFREHFRMMGRNLVGAQRILKKITDPVFVIPPGTPEDKYPDLPPMKTRAQLQKERLDDEANTALRRAVSMAYGRGASGLVAYHGCPPPAEEEMLVCAMDSVRMRGLDLQGENAVLINRGETWLRVLRSERDLVRATAQAKPELLVVGNKRNTQGVPGLPWLSTFMGQQCEASVQQVAWGKIEDLSVAIRSAKDVGAEEGLIKNCAAVLAELIARVRELPNDRLILDPEGEGLKILPKGHLRAVKPTTGEYYLYETDLRIAGDVDEPPPPRELLDDVAVDAARPVCADYAAGRRCRGGRRCPWRHQKPEAGDAIRECILRREDD